MLAFATAVVFPLPASAVCKDKQANQREWNSHTWQLLLQASYCIVDHRKEMEVYAIILSSRLLS